MFFAVLKKLVFKVLQQLALMIPKDRKLVLFGAFSGEHYGDNTAALYEYLRKHNPKGWRLVWLTDCRDALRTVRGLGGEAHRKRSLMGIWLSLRTPLIVTSHGPQDVLQFFPAEGKGMPKELYLHHGIPLRHGIFREKQDWWRVPPANSQARFSGIALTIATSDWASGQQLKNIPVDPSRVLVTGLPRNDKLFDRANDAALKTKFELGRFNVLYAPTWRRWEATRFFPFEDYDLEKLVTILSRQHITLILRPHHADLRRPSVLGFWDSVRRYPEVFKVITVKEHAAVEDLLRLADCLVTDYSSIHYDYLLTDRPIIYLPYDLKQYVEQMGQFNCDYEQFTPGPKPKQQYEFLDWLIRFSQREDPFAERRRKLKQVVHLHKDGAACPRVAMAMEKELLNG